MVTIQLSSGDTMHDDAKHGDLIVFALSREEIQKAAIGDAVDRLMILSDSQEYTLKFEGKLAFMVTGYDDDRRELFEIPEVLRFVREIDAQWAYWFHFFEPDLGFESLQNILKLLWDLEKASATQGQVSAGFRDAKAAIDASNTTRRLFRAMNALHAHHGISEEVTARRTQLIASHALPS